MRLMLTTGALICAALAWAAPLSTASDHPIETDADRAPRTRTGGSCVIRGATVHTAVGTATVADVWVQDGKLKAIGDFTAPEGIVELDGTGKHLTPGVVDPHSHMGITRGVNEGSVSISAEVRIGDSIDPDDVALYRALAGGCTTIHTMHGSANAIGGQNQVLKLKWGRSADELKFEGATPTIKFALGENPRRANWGDGDRFPGSRMGVHIVFERAFERAREYQREWAAYSEALANGEDAAEPRRDLRLEAIGRVLDGSLKVHCHCYRVDGILMILGVAERYGFRIGVLQHVLEGYKVAAEIKASGAATSTFADWWSYKVEAYDAIPENAALLARAGVSSSINSDSDDLVRRMYGEAAKSVRYAGMDPVGALQLITLIPAQQLGIENRVGSIEVGKDADLVLLNGPPLSSLTRVEWTMVEGELEFERRDAFGLDAEALDISALEFEAPEAHTWDPEGGATTALVGGTVHTVVGETLEQGTVIFQAGRILAVGTDLPIPGGARIVDVTGKHVYPGMIALNTALGIAEIESVRATQDTREIGGNQPDVGVAEIINAESAHFGVTRAGGVTRTQTAPQGGGPLRGQSAVLRLVGDTPREMVQIANDMLHVSFPRVRNGDDDKKTPDAVFELEALFDAAREYRRLQDEAEGAGIAPPSIDPRLAALAPYALGERPVALHASNAQTILFALRFAKEQELDAVLYGATEAWKVVDSIAREGLPVVIGPVLGIPSSRFDPYDAVYANAAVLARAGVPFAIQSSDNMNPRNLADHAAMAASFGLPREEALRSITHYPARVLGLEGKLGGLASGMLADVIVTDGDLLEITASVDYVFIDGRQVDLDNRQTRFFERYSKRLERMMNR